MWNRLRYTFWAPAYDALARAAGCSRRLTDQPVAGIELGESQQLARQRLDRLNARGAAAGTAHPRKATAARMSGTIARVSVSRGRTPDRRLSISGPTASAAASPSVATMPVS